ncbi:YicC family protein [Jannaschia seosinensis]|nr:DUF1732 domain-containing protein [Jannaschia seosinensis]
MTGYAALDAHGRRWELRSVNARGLDLRVRLPDVSGLEPRARTALSVVAARGSLTLSLRMDDAGGGEGPALDEAALSRALEALARIRAAARNADVMLAEDRATDLLSLRGVWEARAGEAAPLTVLEGEMAELIAAWDADRVREGAGLRDVLTVQIDEIGALAERAAELAPARAEHIAAGFRDAIARVRDAGMDEARVAQEIAALAVKADVTEEIDRLRLHVDAARKLLGEDAPVGRRLDFLSQELIREANTLCAKAGMAKMTTIGLALKAVIDRLREQVQNVE